MSGLDLFARTLAMVLDDVGAMLPKGYTVALVIRCESTPSGHVFMSKADPETIVQTLAELMIEPHIDATASAAEGIALPPERTN